MKERLKKGLGEQLTNLVTVSRSVSSVGAGGIISAELIRHEGNIEAAFRSMPEEEFLAFIGLTAIGLTSHVLRLRQLHQGEQEEL